MNATTLLMDQAAATFFVAEEDITQEAKSEKSDVIVNSSGVAT